MHPPAIPGFLDRVNFIVNYWWQGCEAPFKLFVQFAGPPAGQAIALLIGLDMGDIVKEFFRPAGLRSHRHGRKGARKRAFPPELPDPNEEIGKRLPGQKEFAGRPYGSPTFFVFEVTDVADRVAFNLAIVDIVTETVYAGLLGIVSVNQSKCPWMIRMQRHHEGGALLRADDWISHEMSWLDYESPGLGSSTFGSPTPGGGTFLAAMEVHGVNNWVEPYSLEIGLFDVVKQETYGVSALAYAEPGESFSLTCSGILANPGNLIWMHRGGMSTVNDMTRTVNLIGMTKGNGADP